MNVEISNSEYLKLLLDTAPEHQDLFWCLRTKLQLKKLQNLSGYKLSEQIEKVSEGGGIVKTLAFFLRNKLSKQIKTGLSSTNTSEKLDATLSALGIVGSIGIMNIGMEDKGKSLLSRGVIIRGLINELYDEGIITQKEKDLFND